MITTGKLIEYLDDGKFVCALVTECQPKRLRLLTQTGRETHLPINRVIHCSTETLAIDENRDNLTKALKEATERRRDLMAGVDLQEIWEIVVEDDGTSFSPHFLAELSFGSQASDDLVSAFLRCVFDDRLFFKYKEGKVRVNSPEQVEQLRHQQLMEAKRRQLIEQGAEVLSSIMAPGSQPPAIEGLVEELLNLIKDFYLFGNEARDADVARQLLKTAGLVRPHDPYHLLVKAGVWLQNENLPLLRNNLPVNFCLAARKQAECILQRGQQELFEDQGRRDLTHLAPMTIDGPTTLDFDDALTVEETEEGYLIGVHISDVAHYVRPGDPLFLEAMNRGTSIYFPEGQIPMLPRHLSQGICSLIQDEVRATFSFMFHLTADGEVTKSRIFPSIIKVKRRLTYEEVDSMLESDPEIRILNQLQQRLRARRLETGALLLPFPDLNIFIDHQGKVHVSQSKSDTPARTIVSEMMILANTMAAKFISDRMVPGLYRSQPELQHRIVFGEDDDLFQNTLQRKHIPRGELSTEPKSHSGLGVGQYTTVTSPIRRLLDLVMQHQLHSIVRRQEPCFSLEMCKDFSSVLNRVLTTANNVRHQRQRYWLLKYLADHIGQRLEALVIQVGPRRVNLLLPDLLMDIDLPTPGSQGLQPNTLVKVRVVDADPLDNIAKFDW